jgi:chromodomain-helicase-DNA-binding protein 7
MGLGKTVQTMSVLEHLRTRCGTRGPFLVVAPLSTLGHWKREADEWTDMNAIYYHDPVGGAEARALIREHEFQFPGPLGAAMAKRGVFKFNALITSFHVLLSDWEYLADIPWRVVVVDEAHALKNRASQLQAALQGLHYDHLMLLTGTPLQNDMQELWSLLNLIRPDRCVIDWRQRRRAGGSGSGLAAAAAG